MLHGPRGCMHGPGGCMVPGAGAWSRGVHGPRGVCMVRRGGGIPACTEAEPPPCERMTNRCKNITLPQTSFAGGNKATLLYYFKNIKQ